MQVCESSRRTVGPRPHNIHPRAISTYSIKLRYAVLHLSFWFPPGKPIISPGGVLKSGRKDAAYYYVRIRDRRSPGQDGGSDLGRRAGRGARRGPNGPCGLRGSSHDWDLCGLWGDHHQNLRGRTEAGAPGDRRYRLYRRRNGFRFQDLRRSETPFKASRPILQWAWIPVALAIRA